MREEERKEKGDAVECCHSDRVSGDDDDDSTVVDERSIGPTKLIKCDEMLHNNMRVSRVESMPSTRLADGPSTLRSRKSIQVESPTLLHPLSLYLRFDYTQSC